MEDLDVSIYVYLCGFGEVNPNLGAAFRDIPLLLHPIRDKVTHYFTSLSCFTVVMWSRPYLSVPQTYSYVIHQKLSLPAFIVGVGSACGLCIC